MHTYVVPVRYSKDGVVWNSSTFTIQADSAAEAKYLAEGKAPAGYAYVQVTNVTQIREMSNNSSSQQSLRRLLFSCPNER